MTHSETPSAPHASPSVRLYYTVFAALAVLTFATVAVSRLHFEPETAVILAFMIAISKASLVAAFFMHVKYDSRALHLMCAVPTLLTLMLLMALMPDVGMARGPLVAGPPEVRAAAVQASHPNHGHTRESQKARLIDREARMEK